ncbi:MAG: YbjN domain-containing protein [Gammaproteobacteria bacterium]|nr:YbjN domain-containing protein [Gammaproteobacteria bacterium]
MKNMMVIGCLSMFLLAPVTHANDIISAENPDAILDIAKGFGSAILKKDSSGDPFITGRIDGTQYGIIFSGCSDGKECDDILFASAWGGVKVSMNDINAWNRTKKFGRAILDKDEDPRLEMAVNLDYGVTRRNFEDTFNWWTKALSGFKKDVLKK